MTTVLGFDVSSATIGIALLEYSGDSIQLLETEFYKPPKKGHIFERLAAVERKIETILQRYHPDEIVVEDILLGKAFGTTIKTLTTLALFNRTVGKVIFDTTSNPPELLSPMKIRHAIKLSKAIPKKEEVPELIEQHLNINFPYRYNKKQSISVESYDMADAVAVALAHILLKRKSKTKSKKKNGSKKSS